MSKSSDKTEFWVRNISDRNVTLRDLRVSIPAKKSVNLLSKHYPYSYEELKTSLKEGSIFAKRAMIKVAGGPPEIVEESKTISKFPIVRRTRSAVKLEEPVFEGEFEFSDEEFAAEMIAEMNTEFDDKDI